MREVLFVRQAGDLALATSHLAQSSFASRVTAARAGFLLLSQSGERGRGLESESVPLSGLLYLNLGRLLRTSRNSLGPLRSRRLRRRRSSSVANGSLRVRVACFVIRVPCRSRSPFHWRNRRHIRRPPRATNPYFAAWRLFAETGSRCRLR